MSKEVKIKQTEELAKLMNSYSVVGLMDMNKLPSRQSQEIMKQLRGKVLFKMTKKSTLIHAIQKIGKGHISDLEKIVPNQPALILANGEPFKLYVEVNRIKSPSFAKEGDVTDEDVLVRAGPTDLAPGPVISEFAKVKIPAGAEGGKIAVKKDTVVAKRGDKLSKDLVSILRKLKIQTIKIGLNIVALSDKGGVYNKDTLLLVLAYPDKLKECHNQALNLSVAIGYPTKENIGILFAKAYNTAKSIESRVGGVK